MSKTITLRLDEKVYNRLKDLAIQDNRPISNFIETAALRYIEQNEYADEFEMEEIKSNDNLNKSIESGLRDVKAKRGRFV